MFRCPQTFGDIVYLGVTGVHLANTVPENLCQSALKLFWQLTVAQHFMLLSFNLVPICTYDLRIPQCDRYAGD